MYVRLLVFPPVQRTGEQKYFMWRKQIITLNIPPNYRPHLFREYESLGFTKHKLTSNIHSLPCI